MSQAIDGDHRSHLLAILSRSQSNVSFEKGAKATQAAVANFQADFEHTQAGMRQQALALVQYAVVSQKHVAFRETRDEMLFESATAKDGYAQPPSPAKRGGGSTHAAFREPATTLGSIRGQ